MRKVLRLSCGTLFVWMLTSLLALAQATVPNVNDTRVGGQLLFYFDVASYDGAYLTMSNNGTVTVPLHIQLFTDDCTEIFNFRITLGAGCIKIFDMRHFELGTGQFVDLGGTRGLMTATPVAANPSLAAVPYNHLAGSTAHVNLARRNSFGLNAVARLAVDASGNLLPDLSGPLDGTTRLFQLIQPTRLYHDGFFALDSITDSRIILISFVDIYSPGGYLVSGQSALLRGFAGTADCSRLSLPDRLFSCIMDISMESYLGSTTGTFRTTPGTLEMSIPSSYQPYQNVFGITSQTLATFTVNRYMWAR